MSDSAFFIVKTETLNLRNESRYLTLVTKRKKEKDARHWMVVGKLSR